MPNNAENGSTWFDYARFLMRCGQRQVDAEMALRRAISLRPEEDGPSLQEAIFLASIMMNYALPCCLGPDEPRTARFDAAISILSNYVDRHPMEQMPLYFLFIVYALEAWHVHAEIMAAHDAAATEAENGSPTESHSGAAEDVSAVMSESASRHALLTAKAAKWLELARIKTDTFRGSLASTSATGCPTFPELEELVRRERLHRGEVLEAPPEPELPSAWLAQPNPVFPSYESVHTLPEAGDSTALDCIDIMMYIGVPSFVRFLIEQAPDTFGFLAPATCTSERCVLQMVRAAMLGEQWNDASLLIGELFKRSDRNCEGYVLLGECHYRTACASGLRMSDTFAEALAAFETALAFLKESKEADIDPVVNQRVASIYFVHAQEQDFSDAALLQKATEHYKRSLMRQPTAQAWMYVGICTYKLFCLARAQNNNEATDEALLQDAVKYLAEANMLDIIQPEINAWLVICNIELGQVQVAMQTFRQVMRHVKRLDSETAIELGEVLLRFSDEGDQPLSEKKKRLVRQGRYAKEALMLAQVLLGRDAKSGVAHHLAAQAYILLKDDLAAVQELRQALPSFDEDPASQDVIANLARACASRLLGDKQWSALVEQDIEAALERRREANPAVEA